MLHELAKVNKQVIQQKMNDQISRGKNGQICMTDLELNLMYKTDKHTLDY